jgi:tripartite-type tricarboxylate transporter receptor subunit TctC
LFYDAALKRLAGDIAMKSMLKILVTVSGALLCLASSASAQNVEDHFRGKTLRILIPTGPGGDRALYTLPFASFYGRHIPGHPIVTPVFMPGAGGSLALNNIYNVAAPDGLTITTPLASVLNAQLIGDKSVQYDARKFKWIGRTDDATRVLVVSDKVRVNTLEDLHRQEIVVGAVGQASDTATNAVFMNGLFGTKFKVVLGYGASSKIMLAMLNGETQGAFTTWNNVRTNQRNALHDGLIRPIIQIGFSKHHELPNIPLLLDLAQSENDKKLVRLMSTSTLMGQSFAAPPALPGDLLKALREAFNATMKDPDFVKKMAGIGVKFTPMTGEELTRQVDQIMSASSDVVARYKALSGD